MKSTRKPTIVKSLEASPVISLGEPIDVEDFDMRSRLSDRYVASFADSIRTMVNAVGHIQGDLIDKYLQDIPHMADIHDRAMKSWHVVAWFKFFEPYAHPDRKYFVDLERYVEFIKKDAEAYYMYAVFVLKRPSIEVYKALKNLHPEVANRYANHCKNFDIAEYMRDENLKWLFVW